MHKCTENHPFIAHSNLVTGLCKPLLKEFEIRCFSHFRLNEKRQYTGVISDSKWAEEYLANDLQNYDVISFNKQGFENQCVVWSEAHLHSKMCIPVGTNTNSGLQANGDSGFSRTLILGSVER